jgi:hypothetical protein
MKWAPLCLPFFSFSFFVFPLPSLCLSLRVCGVYIRASYISLTAEVVV